MVGRLPPPRNLNQMQFEAGGWLPHSRAMDELNQAPQFLLVAAVFCAIIGLIGYASFMH
jgi:hypothetical protein